MAARYSILLAQGSDVDRQFKVRSGGVLLVFTSRVLRMQVRQLPGGSVLFEATNSNGRLVAGTPATIMVLAAAGSVTGSIPVGEYLYDLWVDSMQLLAGPFVVQPRITV